MKFGQFLSRGIKQRARYASACQFMHLLRQVCRSRHGRGRAICVRKPRQGREMHKLHWRSCLRLSAQQCPPQAGTTNPVSVRKTDTRPLCGRARYDLLRKPRRGCEMRKLHIRPCSRRWRMRYDLLRKPHRGREMCKLHRRSGLRPSDADLELMTKYVILS